VTAKLPGLLIPEIAHTCLHHSTTVSISYNGKHVLYPSSQS